MIEGMANYITRCEYSKKVAPYIGKSLIKVFTGQRRVGKSFVMRQIADEIAGSTPEANIMFIDKEQLAFTHVNDAQSLYDHVARHRVSQAPNYLFIDEVQEISGFHSALRSMLNEGVCDIYCTGSNAKILSGELATMLAGRYIEIPVHALSYREFLTFNEIVDSDEAMNRYITLGGMPYIHNLPDDNDIAFEYLRNVYSSILLKDVVARESIRNVHFMESLVAYLSNNIGSITSANNISRYLKSQRISLPTQSVLNYIHALANAFFIYKIQRADVAGLKIFEVGDKYYFEDWGIRNAIHRFDLFTDIGKLMENIVAVELLRRGYKVYVGKMGDREVDFACEKGGSRLYLQVAYTLSDEKTAEREFAPLLAISDNYPKYVVTMDRMRMGNRRGVMHITLREFLLSQI